MPSGTSGTLLFLTSIALCSTGLAEPGTPFEGTWHAKLSGFKRPIEGTIVLQGQIGSWKFLNKSRNDPCIGLLAPIEEIQSSPDELSFVIARSKAIPQCNNNKAALKRIDENTYSGELNDGRKLTMTRE